MPTYVRPGWPDPVLRDRAGIVIDYGSRWNESGPPADTYSIDSHPERFAPLHLVADALIEHLVQTYDVKASRDALHARDFLRHPDLERVTRLTPNHWAAAPLTFGFTTYPGLILHAGLVHDFTYPTCGCDACDETAVGQVELLDLAAPILRRRPVTGEAVQRPDPGLLRLLDTLEHVPVLLLGRRGNVLARNQLLQAVLGRPVEPGTSFIRYMLQDPRAHLAGTYRQLREFAASATDAVGGHVDVLVNNAGIYPATLTEDLPDDELDAMLAVNVRAPHVLVGALAPAMAERGSGAIVNIGSWMARIGSPFAAMYTATKAADEQLTRAWAAEYGPRGVRVNAVAPGATLTPGNEAARSVLDAMTATTPAGKVIAPQDIANGVLFLASDDAAMIHGITLYVDGGITTTRLA